VSQVALAIVGLMALVVAAYGGLKWLAGGGVEAAILMIGGFSTLTVCIGLYGVVATINRLRRELKTARGADAARHGWDPDDVE
jgi:hypothetical protein